VSWDGSEQELLALREYLDTVWGTGLQTSCQDFFLLDQFLDADSLSFIYTGVLDTQECVDGIEREQQHLLEAELSRLVDLTQSSALNAENHAKLKSAMTKYMLLAAELAAKDCCLDKLRQIVADEPPSWKRPVEPPNARASLPVLRDR
jgi:hypothetical protein